MNDELKVVIIAGPNGAGKTTFAREFLPNEAHCPIFINADAGFRKNRKALGDSGSASSSTQAKE